MPTVQGYSSSEDEVPLPELPEYGLPRISHTKIEELEVEAVPEELKRSNRTKRYIDEATFKLQSISSVSKLSEKPPKKRKKGNLEDGTYRGPWATFDSEEDRESLEDNVEEAEEVESSEDTMDEGSLKPTSEFVGTSLLDNKGRTYMHIPSDIHVLTIKPGSQECYVPKTIIHTFKGHKKGVTKMEIHSHLLLSAGNDGKIKLWNLYHNRELLRIFYGHSQAVTDIHFNSSGKNFLSCGFDRVVHRWDTETGEILNTIQLKAIPNVVKFNPNNESEILVGMSNKKIEHYDFSNINYQVPIQTYDHHLGAINTITIVEDNKRFMTTSDDKSVRFWDWQINIPCKVISDPSQHSMPAAAVYPGGNYIALQSMDNKIKVIQGHGKFKFAKKKAFTGHQVAGYGIEIDFTADGKILMSGDAKGNGYFWDWKSGKLMNRIKASNKPITCIKAHPQESSKVVMAGISGEIYYCD